MSALSPVLCADASHGEIRWELALRLAPWQQPTPEAVLTPKLCPIEAWARVGHLAHTLLDIPGETSERPMLILSL